MITKPLLLTAVALICMALMSSCTDEKDSDHLTGVWEMTYSEGWEIINGVKEEWAETTCYSFMEFNEYGSGYEWSLIASSMRKSFHWQHTGNSLNIFYDVQNNIEPVSLLIYELNSESLITIYQSDNYYAKSTFKRKR